MKPYCGFRKIKEVHEALTRKIDANHKTADRLSKKKKKKKKLTVSNECDGIVTFDLANGKMIVTPLENFMNQDNMLILVAWICIDGSPLFLAPNPRWSATLQSGCDSKLAKARSAAVVSEEEWEKPSPRQWSGTIFVLD